MKFSILILFVFVVTFTDVNAQGEIAIGTWRMHSSGFYIQDVQVTDSRILAAGNQAIYIINKSTQEISVLNKLNRLSSTNISAFAYDEMNSLLLVAYADGNIDLVGNSRTWNFPQIKDASISGGKRINHVLIKGNIAYLSADFGVVVFDLQQRAIRETIREIGSGGSTLRINKSVILNDSIFLATSNGILASRIDGTVNLLDFNNWKRIDQDIFNTEINTIEVFKNKIYSGIDGSGLLSYENGMWQNENILAQSVFKELRSGNNQLHIIADDLIYFYDEELLPLVSSLTFDPNTVVTDNLNTTWIADSFLGLVKKEGVHEERIQINGPVSDQVYDMQYSNIGMLALRGSYNSIKQPNNIPAQLSIFNSGAWSAISSYPIPGIQNLSPCNDLVAFVETGRENPANLISCFGNGIQAYDRNWSEINLPNIILSTAKVISMKRDGEKIWIVRYDDNNPLVSFNLDGSFTSYAFDAIPDARYVQNLMVDANGMLWMLIDPLFGGGILLFDPHQQRSRLINEQADNGSLPDRRVYSLSLDRSGQVWVGTHQGVCYFSPSTDFFASNLNAVRPIFENRFLLRDQRINAIAVDGGNRKWISSNNGIWLFSPDGEQQVNFFNASNSPLSGNNILAIAIIPQSGEVFFATSAGIASYRSDATTSMGRQETVKIFPNPVTGDFSGTVGITGLAADVNVKITDVSGRLVWETRANGGTATWNLRDLNGTKVKTGIYLVFGATNNGKETQVGKIAVVN